VNVRVVRGVGTALVIFVLVQLGALSLVAPFESAGYRAVENPSDPTNSLVYLGAILVVTALMLAAFRYDFARAVRGVILLSAALLSWYVFSVVVPDVPVRGLVVIACSLGVAVALLLYPEWYVIDAAGVLMGAGAAGLFGISFGLLPAVVLLVALAVYDAVSVYGTEHMLDLAEGVLELNVPVVLVVPVASGYSLLRGEGASPDTLADRDADAAPNGGASTAADGNGYDADGPPTDSDGDESEPEAEDDPESEERDALFIGLGDAVMPTVMVASAASFSPAPTLGLPVAALNLPALLAAVGTIAGLLVLLRNVLKGEAHAGLPLLNGGAVGGYLLGSVAAGVPLVSAVGLAPYL
jgi:presenilin-like A22 family membrane protease